MRALARPTRVLALLAVTLLAGEVTVRL